MGPSKLNFFMQFCRKV